MKPLLSEDKRDLHLFIFFYELAFQFPINETPNKDILLTLFYDTRYHISQ